MRAVPGQARDNVRHCQDCNLRVYNLSALKRHDAERLLLASEGRLCIRLYRRSDGTVLTQDCTFFRRVGDTSAAGVRRVAWLATCGLAALMGSAVWAGSLIRDPETAPRTNIVQSGLERLAQVRPIDRFVAWLRPAPVQGMAPAGWGPPGTWIAGGRGPVIGDIVQGEIQPLDPMPRQPEQWLSPAGEMRIPL
jgi:hypothetical protein